MLDCTNMKYFHAHRKFLWIVQFWNILPHTPARLIPIHLSSLSSNITFSQRPFLVLQSKWRTPAVFLIKLAIFLSYSYNEKEYKVAIMHMVAYCVYFLSKSQKRTPGWLSGWVSAFGSGHDSGSRDQVPHQAPCEEPASPSAYVSASLSVSHEQINKIFTKKINMKAYTGFC